VVPDTGKTLRADAGRPVNAPEPVRVEEDDSGLPAAVVAKRRRQMVAAVEDRWRLDDEWWRPDSIGVSRLYFSVRLASGHRLVLYKDLATGEWYRQGY
jgi:hypothetical protein